MIKDYKITGKLIPGAIYLRYENGTLAAVLFEFTAAINPQVYESFKACLNLTDNMQRMYQSFDVRELHAGRSVQDKIVMFCGAYKHYRGVPYKAKELEKANLKNTPVSRELLDVFFKSPLANYTLDNYIKRINITRDWAHNGMNNHLADAFPDEWNEEYSRTLTGERLSKYYIHLRELGWQKDERGNWKQAAAVVVLLLLLVGCAYTPQPTKPENLKPRKYDKEYKQWLDAEYPLKVFTGTKKKRLKR